MTAENYYLTKFIRYLLSRIIRSM